MKNYTYTYIYIIPSNPLPYSAHLWTSSVLLCYIDTDIVNCVECFVKVKKACYILTLINI